MGGVKIKFKLKKDGLAFEPERLARLFDVLTFNAMNEAVTLTRRNIKIKTPKDSGQLSSSILQDVRSTGIAKIRGIIFSDQKYAVPQEKGFGGKGKRPPTKPLEQWLRRKGIVGKTLRKRGRPKKGAKKPASFASRLQRAAFGLSQAIAAKRRKGRKFFAKGFKESEPRVRDILDRAWRRLFDLA